MIIKQHFFLCLACIFGLQPIFAQQWVDLMHDPSVNFHDVKQAFDQAWGNQPYVRGKGYKQYKRWEYFMEERTFPHGKRPRPNQAWEEHYKFQSTHRAAESFAARAANWQPLGPENWTNTTGWNPGNGRINCVAEDPNNSSVLYAGAPSGGLWKSTNGGSSWVCLTDDQPILGVSAIVVDPNNSNHIFIGTGDGYGSDTYSIGVLESIDGGASWQTTGLSWSTGNARLIRRLIMHPSNNQIMLAATNNGIYRTTDGGSNWTQAQTGSMRDIKYKPGDPMTVYACTDEFYKSTDGGQNFTKITTGLPSAADVNRAQIAVSPDNANYVYILFGDGSDSGFYGLYRSSNSGTSFSLRSNTPNIFTYDQTGSGTGGQSWYDMALAVSPTNAEEVYSGGINVWKSTNGGSSWTISTHWVHPATLGYVHADIHTLDFFGNNRLYCGSDGGLSVTSNAGNNWNFLSFGMEIMQFYRFGVSAQNAYQIIGGAQDNGTNYLDPNGNWIHVLGADGMEAAIDYSNAQIMYGETQSGGLNRSTDGGQNWGNIEPSGAGSAAWVMPYIIDPNTPATLYAAYQEVWKSTNRGNSWTQISNFGATATLRYIAAAPSNSNYIYVGSSGTLRMTSNGGGSWSTITPNISAAIKYVTVHPTDPQKVWITLSGFNAGEKVFYSEDAGTSWQNISANLPNLPVNCIAYQNGSPDGLYVGTDVGIYYIDSTLANWQPFMTGLPNVIVNELEIHYGVNKIRAATYGRGIWESDLFSPSPFPPTASFNYDTDVKCQGDSIRFNDQSINAAPGWQWYFPGGSPASSTDQSPMVYYPNAGTYTATLIVSNTNGNDTINQNVTVAFAPNQISLQILLDNYPEETTWDITDASGNIVRSAGPYGGAGTTKTENICLNDGCYAFTIYDSYGDGICCGFGNGNYQLTDASSNVLASGGQFTDQEGTLFCLNQTPPVSVSNVSSTVSNCGVDDASLTITAAGGDGNYQYSMDGTNYQAGSTFSNLAPGTYTVYVQDGQGTVATSSIQVTEESGPNAVASPDAITTYLNTGGAISVLSVLSSNANSYSWDFGDGNTSTQMNTTHNYTAVGTYYAILTAYNDNCADTDTVVVIVDLTNDLTNSAENQQPQLSISPNPFQDQFNMSIELPNNQKEMEISVHNALGQLVYWETVNDTQTAINRNLHFGNFADGVYILSIQTEEYKMSRKFVKASGE